MPASVGLAGDGDEVAAIEEAFARFGVPVSIDGAGNWITVGDVWSSLLRIKPLVIKQPNAFQRFCASLCDETGVDPTGINESSRLLI